MIEFTDQRSGVVVGVVAVRGNALLSDPISENIAAAWLAQGGKSGEFESVYDGWTNGYVLGRRVANNAAVIDNMRPVKN